MSFPSNLYYLNDKAAAANKLQTKNFLWDVALQGEMKAPNSFPLLTVKDDLFFFILPHHWLTSQQVRLWTDKLMCTEWNGWNRENRHYICMAVVPKAKIVCITIHFQFSQSFTSSLFLNKTEVKKKTRKLFCTVKFS